MSTVPIIKRIFNSGEFSPKVYGRTDLDRYEGGSKTLENILPIPQGGIVRRPGTGYIATAAENNVRLVPFQFSTTQAYVLEWSNGTMRVFKDGGIVLGNNNAVYTLNTNMAWADVADFQYAQSFDTMYIVGNNFAPKELTRTGHNNWNLNPANFNHTYNNNVVDTTPSQWGNNNGWPRCVSFYQDRLVFASTAYRPHSVWFSKTSNYTDMTQDTGDGYGFRINLLSGTADVIQWLSSHKSLIAGADSGVWSIMAANGSAVAISPTNRRANKDSYFGSARVLPARLGDHIIYPQYLAGKMRDLSYSYEADAYTASEISVLADHLFESYQITEMAYQQSPFEIIWMRRSDGTLLALTYLAEHKVIGWSKHQMGNVMSIACIPGNLETELWLATSRNINNNNVTYIERMSSFYFSGMNNAFFVDSGISGNAASNNVGGLNHLEGKAVQYLADGVSGIATVSGGAISLSQNSANNLVVGLGFNSTYESLPAEVELKSGPTMFKTKRIVEMGVRVRNSAGATYGPDASLQTKLLNNNALVDGDFTNLSIRGGHNAHRTVMIKQTLPYPLAIDAIGLEVEVE